MKEMQPQHPDREEQSFYCSSCRTGISPDDSLWVDLNGNVFCEACRDEHHHKAAVYRAVDFMRDLTGILPPSDPTRLFWEWARENTGRIKEAVADLGVDPYSITQDKQFVQNLIAAVGPALVKQYEEAAARRVSVIHLNEIVPSGGTLTDSAIYPARAYEYDRDGFHTGPTYLNSREEVDTWMVHHGLPAIKDQREVMVTDIWDECLFRSKGGTVLQTSPGFRKPDEEEESSG